MRAQTVLFRRRLAKLLTVLREGPDTLLLGSAPLAVRSRDTHYPYRQNSDFWYLTGLQARDTLLLVGGRNREILLIVPPVNPVRVVWEGPGENLKRIARDLGAELVVSENPEREARARLGGTRTVFTHNIPGSIAWEIAQRLFALPSHERAALPARFAHSDVVIEPLRLYKDRDEVARIQHAAKITAEGIRAILPMIVPGTREADIAAALEYQFIRRGGHAAFRTISATGPSAATLHYESYRRRLRRGELFLLDCGAEYEMYSADITRMFPVGGVFEHPQRMVYDIVLRAQRAALKTVRDGVRVKAVYDAAAKEIAKGLVKLGLARGTPRTLIENGTVKRYFPHGIGHTLGLDTHDVGNFRGNPNAVLRRGMVFTVEPGIYLPKPLGGLPPCGVRIEDDVYVTARGAEILTSEIPKERRDIEELMASR